MLEQFHSALAQYPLYTKGVYSSLAIPEVLEAAKRADRVIIGGVVAECCVLSTVLALIDAGIYTVYLTDGVSGFTKEKEAATELIFSGLSPLHIQTMTVDEYLAE
jgi:nicotinamidase-related amidase